MLKKKATTTRNKPQKKILYRKKHFTKRTKAEKKKRDIGGLLLGLSENVAEPTRNVTEIMPTTTNTTHKKIIHCDKHFIKQKQIKNLMKRNKKKELTWKSNRYCESDFARSIDTSESVGGAVIYLCGAVIDWKSKRQRTVMLSSTGADSEVAADITANEKNIQSKLPPTSPACVR